MSRYFTSDTHFFHERIIELCDRPFKDVEHMNEMLVANWNAKVGPEDEVYHLGDVMMGQNFEEHLSLLDRLNGHKTLVVGNHDRMFGKMSNQRRERWMEEYGKYFESITNADAVVIGGKRAYLSHFPYDGDTHSDRPDRYVEDRLPDDGVPLIHGHTHQNKKISRSLEGTLQIHVGVDAWNYEPVSEEMIEFILKEHA